MITTNVNEDTNKDNKDLAEHALAWMALLEAAQKEAQEQMEPKHQYVRMSVEQLLASKNKRLRQIGHQLKYYGKV